MKPTKEAFENAVEKYGGNITKIAKAFNVSRTQIYNWMAQESGFKDIVNDIRGTLFDDCLSTARVIAMGIPKIEDGKMVGWVERPDSGMLKYLLGSLGRKEGFGENIDITSDGKSIAPSELFRVLTPDEIRSFDQYFEENY